MPEGAEVRIISEGLAKKVAGRTCVEIIPVSGRYTKKSIPGLELFQKSKIVGVGVKGKLIFWLLNNDTYLLNTLGMTGTWSSNASHKHARVRFRFSKGPDVFYVDTRNFGTLKLIEGKTSFLQKLATLGPDLLNEEVTYDEFAKALDKKKHWTIAKALMDQSIVCGVGNYVKAEALYRAKISPHRVVGSLSSDEIMKLKACCQTVLRQAYNGRGATIQSYKDADGNSGNATLKFKVYGKKVDLLGNEIVREKTADGRTTHWVPSVQK